MNLCNICYEKCGEEEAKECMEVDYANWSPKDKRLCVGCEMYAEDNGKCCRHAEPCLRKDEIIGKLLKDSSNRLFHL